MTDASEGQVKAITRMCMALGERFEYESRPMTSLEARRMMWELRARLRGRRK